MLKKAGLHYVRGFGVPIKHASVNTLSRGGFIGHDETPQGLAIGKDDPGYKFDWDRFIHSLEAGGEEEGEEDMAAIDDLKKELAELRRAIWSQAVANRLRNDAQDASMARLLQNIKRYRQGHNYVHQFIKK